MNSALHTFFYLIALLFFLVIPDTSWAFKISPCLRVLTYSPGVLSADKLNALNPCTLGPEAYRLPVHEQLTNFSIDEYKGGGFIPTAQKEKSTKTLTTQTLNYRHLEAWNKQPSNREHSTSDLIYGSWWNDDPLMFLWSEGADFRLGVGKLNKLFSSRIQSRYPGGGNYKCENPRKDNLAWNSHFGTLQHLHFMSTVAKGDTINNPLNTTLDKSLEWIEFAYRVATLQIAYNDKLTPDENSRLHLPSMTSNLCLKDDSNVTIRTLFSRPDFEDDRRRKMIPDVALGTIFHIMQDSFSPSHTCRIDETVDGKQFAVLTEAYNYNRQDTHIHGKLDYFPQWLLDYSRTGIHKYENDPVKVGAWLLQAVDAGTPWPEVKEHLLNSIFKRASSPPPAGIKCIGT